MASNPLSSVHHNPPQSTVHVQEQLAIDIHSTTHQFSKDTWFQVSVLLMTGINSAFVLGYSAAFMVPLSWVAGVVGLLVATALSLYANCLIGDLHEYGGERHLRYRDLALRIYGKSAYYYLSWTLQYANLLIFNIGFIILAGQALKAVYLLLSHNHIVKLPFFTAAAGLVCAVFAIGIPHLSALKVWLGFSTIFSLLYMTVTVVLSFRDGIKAHTRDYSIPGSGTDKILRIIGGTANLFFAFNTGILPEIQATVRQPVVENTRKALYLQFTLGVLPLYAVVFVGYWAFGNSSSSYLLSNVSGPAWLKIIANLAAFFQSVIALHVFASPTYEYLDTSYGPKGSASWIEAISFRIKVRGSYIAITTFAAALLPFLGDFMSLGGAVSTFPLTFILGNHMYLMAKGNKMTCMQKLWHWLNIIFFTILSSAAGVAAMRLIKVDSKTYSLFADL